MIIGTAGHVDHGKSALVEALTGKRMDRLVEERRRGITIELNFAPLDLGEGQLASVIDVPGHEDLVRTMVAGASGIDCVLLVIAADEGIMPQTEEHLLVAEMLHVPHGIAVLTKTDAVEAEWLELVREEVAQRIAASPIAFGEPHATSARTGAGVEELRSRLRVLAGAVSARATEDLFRLPVDRAFSVAGVGTVVTGTSWSGSVATGDEVLALPSGARGRVRSLESHGQQLDRALPGTRVAVGLQGVTREQVQRGEQLVTSGGGWTATTRLDVELELNARAPRALARRTRVRVLHGTAEVLGRVALLAPLAPGARGVARLRLEKPLVARGGDRFVLRSYSPVQTIGGGRVLDPDPPARAKQTLAALAGSDPMMLLSGLVARRGEGLPLGVLPVLWGASPAEAERQLRAAKGIVSLRDRLVLSERVRLLEEALLATLERYHQTHPHDAGAPAEALRRGMRAPEWLAREIVDRVVRRRTIEWRDGLLARTGFVARPAAGPADVSRLLDRLRSAGLAPPSVADLAGEMPTLDVPAALRMAAKEGTAVAVERDRYYAREALDGFVAALREIGAAGDVTPGALRDRTGASRKYLIPLLEWADRAGITVRAGEARRLARA